jgi:hypothetical protein
MEVQKLALHRAIAMLTAAKCQFAVIDAEGNKYGALEVAAPPQRTRGAFPRGTLVAHFQPHIKDMKPGDAVCVPYGMCADEKPHRDALQKAIASHLSAAWGRKTYITHMNDKGVEVLRVE